MKKTIQIENFSKGFNTSKHPQELDDDEFAVMENLDLKRYGSMGKVAKRYPIVRYNSNQFNSASKSIMSMYEYRKQSNSTNYLLANNSDGASSKLLGTPESSGYAGTWSIGAKTSADLAYKLQFTTLKDRVYIANYGGGASANQTWDGTNFLEMGCPPCDTADATFTPSNGAGSLTSSSTYFYLITFLYDNFQEGAILSAGTVVLGVADDTVTITNIPTGNARCTARKIYRSKVSSPPYYYYVGTIQDNTTTSYTDLLADAALGDEIDIYDYFTKWQRPYASKYHCTHKDRMIQGNLKDMLFGAMASADITLTPSNGAGALTSNTTYNYKFYKIYFYQLANPAYIVSQPLSKSVVMGATDDTVTISYSGTDPFVKYIAIERAGAGSGSTDYRILSIAAPDSRFWDIAASYTDLIADASRTVDTIGTYATLTSEGTNYPSWVAFSDASKPDLFPSGNIMKIGQDDSDAITGIWSVEDRLIVFKSKTIHEIDTTAVHPDFWRTNKIVDGIGADAGAQILANDTFYFVSTTSITKNKFAVYEWSGRGEPQPIDYPIRKYVADLNANGTIVFKDIAFDKINNRIIILIDDTTRSPANQFIFQYDLDLRKWQPVIYNGDMKLNCIGVTRDYGVLYGLNTGYLNYQKPNPTSSEFKDDVNGNLTEFTTKLKTKTFTVPDGDLRPREVRGLIETDIASGTLTLALKTCSDNGTEYSANMMVTAAGSTTLVDGINRVRTTNFNTVDKDTPHRTVYFSLEEANNMDLVYHNLNIDLRVEHQGARGK